MYHCIKYWPRELHYSSWRDSHYLTVINCFCVTLRILWEIWELSNPWKSCLYSTHGTKAGAVFSANKSKGTDRCEGYHSALTGNEERWIPGGGVGKTQANDLGKFYTLQILLFLVRSEDNAALV